MLPIFKKDSDTGFGTQARTLRLDKNMKSSYKVRSRGAGVVGSLGRATESLTRTGKLVIKKLLVRILSIIYLDSISRS